MVKIQRNAPCACGSGTKSKKCCETAEKISARRKAEEEAFWAKVNSRRPSRATMQLLSSIFVMAECANLPRPGVVELD